MGLTMDKKEENVPFKSIKLKKAMLLKVKNEEGVGHFPEGHHVVVKTSTANDLVGDGRAEFSAKGIDIAQENKAALDAETQRLKDGKSRVGASNPGNMAAALAQAKEIIEGAKEQAAQLLKSAKEDISEMIKQAKESLKTKQN